MKKPYKYIAVEEDNIYGSSNQLKSDTIEGINSMKNNVYNKGIKFNLYTLIEDEQTNNTEQA
jgi:hypothetical protein